HDSPLNTFLKLCRDNSRLNIMNNVKNGDAQRQSWGMRNRLENRLAVITECQFCLSWLLNK
ncbi:Hypothetical predicted protein, partial [Podarcis lilfordi]